MSFYFGLVCSIAVLAVWFLVMMNLLTLRTNRKNSSIVKRYIMTRDYCNEKIFFAVVDGRIIWYRREEEARLFKTRIEAETICNVFGPSVSIEERHIYLPKERAEQ